MQTLKLTAPVAFNDDRTWREILTEGGPESGTSMSRPPCEAGFFVDKKFAKISFCFTL